MIPTMRSLRNIRNTYFDMIVIITILSIAYIRPYFLVNFFNTIMGRFVLILCILALASIDTFLGLLGILLLVCFRENITIEGMEDMNSNTKNDEKSNTENNEHGNEDGNEDGDADKWRKTNCKANQVMLGDSVVDMDEFSKKFPNVKFTNGECNPCMKDCKIKVTSSVAKLDIENGVRPKPSNSLPNLAEQA